MSTAPEVLLEQALAMSHSDRAKLATGLLASLEADPADEAEVERLWSEETDRRSEQLSSGEVKLTTWEQVTDHCDELKPLPHA